ncbi:MAG: PD40 domain-containing protein, partial [Bryobacterales bacterium]|nr:PD40 domain-containing protein [Bryobacterales bacterium]
SVAFAAGQELKKSGINGGLPFVVTRFVGGFRGGDWSEDGSTIVFSIGAQGLFEVPAKGGSQRTISRTSGFSFYYPQFLPSTGAPPRVLVGKGTRGGQTLELIDVATGKSETIREGAYPAYSPSGHILFRIAPSQPGLWALAFSPRTLKAQGEPFPLLNAGSDFNASLDGTLVWVDAVLAAKRQMVWRDRSGAKLAVAGAPESFLSNVSISPDGTRAAYSATEHGNSDIWIQNLNSPARTRFTFGSDSEFSPCWAPSGKEIAFNSGGNILLQAADGSGEAKAIVTSPLPEMPLAWSPDGLKLLFLRNDPSTGGDLWFVRRKADGSFGEPVPFLRPVSSEQFGQFSPDGRFVVYGSDESGRREVYVRPFPEGGGKWQISTNGGVYPRWRADGKEIFYLKGNTLYGVPVSVSGSVSVGTAVELFRNPASEFDVSRDGKRFLMPEVTSVEQTQPPAIHVIQNWTALLRQKN